MIICNPLPSYILFSVLMSPLGQKINDVGIIFTNLPSLHTLSKYLSSNGDLGGFTGGKKMCQGGKPDTGKFHSSCMYVAPPMRMGAWSMARVLRQRIEYYLITNLEEYTCLNEECTKSIRPHMCIFS